MVGYLLEKHIYLKIKVINWKNHFLAEEITKRTYQILFKKWFIMIIINTIETYADI